MKRFWMIMTVFAVAGLARAATEPAKFETADALWTHIEELQQAPSEKKFTSREEAVAFVREHLGELGSAAAEFEQRYPEDKRLWEAKLIQAQAAHLQGEMGLGPVDTTAQEARLRAIVSTNAAPEGILLEAKAI